MLSLGPDDPLIQFITNPVLGFVVTLVTSAAVAFSVRRWPNDKSFWQDVFDWPGKVIVSVSLTTGLVGALPRLVWEPGEFRCNAAGCWVEGGGDTQPRPAVLDHRGMAAGGGRQASLTRLSCRWVARRSVAVSHSGILRGPTNV